MDLIVVVASEACCDDPFPLRSEELTQKSAGAPKPRLTRMGLYAQYASDIFEH